MYYHLSFPGLEDLVRDFFMTFPDHEVFYTQFKAAAASYRHGLELSATDYMKNMCNKHMQNQCPVAFPFCCELIPRVVVFLSVAFLRILFTQEYWTSDAM